LQKRVESPPEQALVDILTGDSANIGKVGITIMLVSKII